MKLFIILIVLLISNVASFAQVDSLLQGKFIVVLDVQECYTSENKVDSSAIEINAINALIKKSDTAQIIYITSVHKLLVLSFKGITIDTADNQNLDKRLYQVSNHAFVKEEGNAFLDKEFLTYLESKGAREIIIVGLLAEECVSKTLVGGLELGFEMYVVPDAIIGKSDRSKLKTIKNLSKKGVKVLNL